LASAAWIDYPQSGVLINNPNGRWIQYQANLHTTNAELSPELQKITLYYIPLWTNTYAEPSEDCEAFSPCYGSIQEAIHNVRTGGSVFVYAGSYPEAVNITDNITLMLWGNAAVDNFSQSSGAVSVNNHTLTLSGDWTHTGGIFNPGTGTVVLAGAGEQTLSAVSAFNRLVIANTGEGVSLASDLNVNTELHLTSGLLNIGDHQLTIAENATIGGAPSAASMIVADGDGMVCKQISSDDPDPFTFTIGDASGTVEYSPAWIDLYDVTGSGCLSVRVTDALHPNNLDLPRLSRYWTVTQTGLSAFTANLNFSYVDSDLDLEGHAEADIRAARYNGSNWQIQGGVDAVNNTFSFTTNAFSDFTGKGNSATAVTVSGLKASRVDQITQLTWSTGTEIDIVGFDVYRSTDPYNQGERINTVTIPAQHSGEIIGAEYVFLDETAQPDIRYFYWIGIITTNGVEITGPAAIPVEYKLFLPVIGG
jgi:hypothetical protein